MKRNLILTCIADYPLARVERFLASWRENVSTAELIVLARNCDDLFYDAAAALGVVVLDLVSRRPYHIMSARHFVYRDVLRAHRRNFDAVLLTDSRDVVFQSDPFLVPREHPVTFAAEDRTIGECPLNGWWLVRIYGPAVQADLSPETIACAGTTIGEREAVLRYLDLMCGEIDAHSDMLDENGDQGFHNYILHRLKPGFIGLDRADTVVNTLGYTDPARMRCERGLVLVDGAAAPVLHQWDRREESCAYVNARYALDREAVSPVP